MRSIPTPYVVGAVTTTPPQTNTTMKNTTLLKSYEVHCRMPLTVEARNAGATGRKFWWAFVGVVNARNKHHACAKLKTSAPDDVVKLRAFNR